MVNVIDEALSFGIVLADCRHNPDIRKSMLEIEAPQQISVGFDAISVVDIRSSAETQTIPVSDVLISSFSREEE